MGTVFTRKGSSKLYVGYKDATGTWRYQSTGLQQGQEAKARQVLASIERRVEAGHELGLEAGATVTVSAYSTKWLEARAARGVVDHPNDVARMRDHVLPVIGTSKLDEVRPRH